MFDGGFLDSLLLALELRFFSVTFTFCDFNLAFVDLGDFSKDFEDFSFSFTLVTFDDFSLFTLDDDLGDFGDLF